MKFDNVFGDVQEGIKNFRDSLMSIDQSLQETSLGRLYEEKFKKSTKIPLAHLLIGIVLLVLLITLLISGESAVCNLIGFVYPFYKSYEALKTPQKDDDTQWLTYWIVFAAFIVVESLSFLFNWIPFYYLFKVLFLIWLAYFKGALIVFQHVLDPALDTSFNKCKKIFGSSSSMSMDSSSSMSRDQPSEDRGSSI